MYDEKVKDIEELKARIAAIKKTIEVNGDYQRALEQQNLGRNNANNIMKNIAAS
jgi:hypothetical protein